MSTTSPAPTIRALTGLRFVAAFHVLLFHTAGSFAHGAPAPIRNLVGSGYASVGLFFVLSGFVLAYQYADPSGALRFDARAYYRARLARVYPVYLFSLLFAMPSFVSWGASNIASDAPGLALAKVLTILGLNVGLVHAWVPPAVGPINPPGWSLSAEVFFYLVFPLAAVRLPRLTQRQSIAAIGALWLASLVAPMAYVWAEGRGLVAGDVQESWSGLLNFNPLLRLPEFLIGLLAGRLFLDRAAAAAPSRRGAVLSLGAAGAAVAALAASSAIPTPLLHAGLLAPVFAVLVYGLALGGGPAARLLATPWLVLLGQASYALYLLHMRMADYVVGIAFWLVGPIHPALLYALYLALVLGASIAVLHWLEEPARRAIRGHGRGYGAARPRPQSEPARDSTGHPASQTPARS